MGQRLHLEWQESTEQLEQLYKQQRHIERRTRLLALWHLRQGKSVQAVVDMLGIGYRTVQQWLAWYRQGGLEMVLDRVRGHGARGTAPYLTALQQRALVAQVELGAFRTVWDAVQWVKDRWGVTYTYKGMHELLARHDCRPKVPRPQSAKANIQ
jgi:transposase